jgi:hypothetical protein
MRNAFNCTFDSITGHLTARYRRKAGTAQSAKGSTDSNLTPVDVPGGGFLNDGIRTSSDQHHASWPTDTGSHEHPTGDNCSTAGKVFPIILRPVPR